MPTPRPNSAEAPAFVSAQVTAARRFYLNLNPRASQALTVVCGGWEECAPDYAIDRKTFPFPSIEFVASGRGELNLGGTRHVLEPGVFFSYGEGVSQRIRSDPAAPLGKYFVNFSGTRGRVLLREHGFQPGTVARLGSATEVRAAFEPNLADASAFGRRLLHRTPVCHATKACRSP